MSRRETAAERHTRTPRPTPYRVSAMPNTVAGARGDSDSDNGAETSGTARPVQRQHEAATTGRPDIPNRTTEPIKLFEVKRYFGGEPIHRCSPSWS